MKVVTPGDLSSFATPDVSLDLRVTWDDRDFERLFDWATRLNVFYLPITAVDTDMLLTLCDLAARPRLSWRPAASVPPLEDPPLPRLRLPRLWLVRRHAPPASDTLEVLDDPQVNRGFDRWFYALGETQFEAARAWVDTLWLALGVGHTAAVDVKPVRKYGVAGAALPARDEIVTVHCFAECRIESIEFQSSDGLEASWLY